MKVKDVLGWLDGLAPFDSAEDFDNVGLLLGDEEAAVRGVTFGMDVTEALVDEALAHGDGEAAIDCYTALFEAVAAAGLDSTQYSAHKLRHTAATLMLQNGVELGVSRNGYAAIRGAYLEWKGQFGDEL